MNNPTKCNHSNFSAHVDVTRLEDSGRYTADVRINCVECNVPMRFIGLPAGVDLNGACVSVDGTEGRFAIAPKGEVLSALDGAPMGFTARVVVGDLSELHTKVYAFLREELAAEESRRETAEAGMVALREAMLELLALKSLKENVGKTPDYMQRKPLAWLRASKAVQSTTGSRGGS